MHEPAKCVRRRKKKNYKAFISCSHFSLLHALPNSTVALIALVLPLMMSLVRVLCLSPNCSTPTGSDRLTMKFYLKSWGLLGEDLVCVLNSCLCSGRLSRSQCHGVISLSFKKGDLLDIRNWPSISLLNVDYKPPARTIAGRLLNVIHLVVGRDQTCGVPGRFIGENVTFLRDIVDFATLSNSPVALLSLDQEKALDRVEWSFMHTTVLKMGFGPFFCWLGRPVLLWCAKCS